MNHIFWIMGLSSSGKSTVSEMILEEFPNFHLLDNDKFRNKFPKHFDRETRLQTCKAILEESIKQSQEYNVIVNKITPYEEIRKYNRSKVPNGFYHEIYCKCPIKEVIKRDVKGLYKKALNNQLEHMIGISDDPNDIYEDPLNADLILETTDTIEVTKKKIINYIYSIMNI